MKMFFLLALVSLPSWAVKVNVECRDHEVIIATDKHNNDLKGAYICEKGLKTPVAIIVNENFDYKLDMEDSITFYVSDTYKGNRKFLKEKFESFEERFKEFKAETGEKDAYFQVDFKNLYDQAEIEELLSNANSKIVSTKKQADDFFAVDGSLRKRYYDPKTQRFLSPDPKGYRAGDPNFYRYVFNNPVRYSDPTGQDVYYNQDGVHTSVVITDPNMPGNTVTVDFNPDSGTVTGIMLGDTVNGRIDVDPGAPNQGINFRYTNTTPAQRLTAFE